jgi:lycopene cyclase domain-containing protein
MNSWAYYLFITAIAASLLMPFVVKIQFWSRWKQLLFGLGAVSAPFILWDITATYQKHWYFNPEYTQSQRLLGLPVEEILFFIVVPLACMVVWAFIQTKRNQRVLSDGTARNIMINAALLFVAVGVIAPGAYTRVVLLAGAISCILLSKHTGLITGKRFWVFQLVVLGLFLVFNTILTQLPIITYNPDAIVGFKLGAIPIEDVLYNFALINLFLLCFMRGDKSLK